MEKPVPQYEATERTSAEWREPGLMAMGLSEQTMTMILGMAEGVSWHEGCLRLQGTSKTVRERSELSLSVTNRSDNTTTKVCQATLRSSSELAGPQLAEEGHDSPTAEGQTREQSPVTPCQLQVRNCMNMSSG